MSKVNYIVLLTLALSMSSCDGKKNTKQISEEQEKLFLYKGNKITSVAFRTLSSNLKYALNKHGISGAIKYCSLKADPLVDSLSREYNVKIKRTSMYIRNPGNVPNAEELEILESYNNEFEAGKELKAKLKMHEDGSVVYYAPITINRLLCLNCHGKLATGVLDENYKIIKEIYPNDKAIGYEEGDFRGMWSITFEAEEKKEIN